MKKVLSIGSLAGFILASSFFIPSSASASPPKNTSRIIVQTKNSQSNGAKGETECVWWGWSFYLKCKEKK